MLHKVCPLVLQSIVHFLCQLMAVCYASIGAMLWYSADNEASSHSDMHQNVHQQHASQKPQQDTGGLTLRGLDT